MGVPIPLSVTRQQPQQGVPLDKSSPFAANALAIISAGADFNYVTGYPLTRGGSGYQRGLLQGGRTWAFRKNFLLETESLPAIGTKTFVEFWVGYPNATLGTNNDGTDAAYATGSGNNLIGIARNIGWRSATGTLQGGNSWGVNVGWNNTPTLQYAAGEVLTPGAYTVLVVVRRQSGIEFWRNGVLISTVASTPVSLPATSFIVGSLLRSTTWYSSNDTLMAGRAVFEPTPQDIQAFSANPCGVFKSQSNLPMMAALLASASSGAAPGALLVPAGAARTSGASSLSTGTALSTQGAQAAAGAASIQAAVSLSAAGLTTAAGSASLSTTAAGMSAAGAIKSAAGAALSASVSMSTAAGTQSSGGALLSAAGTWAVQSVCSTSAGASLLTSSQFAAVAIMKASGAAAVTTQIALGAVAKAATSSGAALGAGVKLALSVASRVSGNASLTAGAAQQGAFDVSRISPARTVVFEGSGSRIVPFEGGGNRVVVFEGSGSRVVVFEGSGNRKVRFE